MYRVELSELICKMFALLAPALKAVHFKNPIVLLKSTNEVLEKNLGGGWETSKKCHRK